MHRAALRISLRHSIALHRRSFVSTVLLTKAWENETINELRKEAKKRGLASTGNKANLVSRLQQDDKRSLTLEPVSASSSQVRHASTAPSPTVETPTEVPGIPSTAEFVHPKYNLAIQIPDISTPEPEAPVQIPFVPDLWESSTIKHESVPDESAPSTEPKVVVIAGEITIPGSAPSHNVYSPGSSSSYADIIEHRKEPTSLVGHLVADMADDFGLSSNVKLLPQSSTEHYDLAAKTETSGDQEKSYSRTLDEDERMGLWALLGVFSSSFIAASIFAPKSEWAHKKEAVAQDAQEEMAGKTH